MERSAYDEMAKISDTHWWFVARRALVRHLLKSAKLPKNASILEAGCGDGSNLPLWQEFGQVHAFEPDEAARNHAKGRGIGTIDTGFLPNDLPFAEQSFDLIAMCDVLEHVEQDGATLKALQSQLKPDGTLLLTVPAFPFLFSAHDTQHHHHRRYRKDELVNLLQDAGYQIDLISYWNALLFPIAALLRLKEKWLPSNKPSAGSSQPAGAINEVLIGLVSMEKLFLRFPGLPFGISLVVLAKKTVSR